MLLNGVHLLPDLSGALIWPKARLVAVADPIGDEPRQAPRQATEAIKRLSSVLRQRRPKTVVWLGGALPHLLAAGTLARRDADELARLAAGHDWVWVARDLPAGLPGRAMAEFALDALIFRPTAQPQAASGEVSALPSPLATIDGQTYSCFAIDGRRLVMPALGPSAGGTNVLAPPFQALFRRPFQALMLAGGRIVTRPRARLQ